MGAMTREQTIDEEFLKLQEASKARWEELEPGDLPVIMVGTGTCGRAAGAMETLDDTRMELETRGVAARIV